MHPARFTSLRSELASYRKIGGIGDTKGARFLRHRIHFHIYWKILYAALDPDAETFVMCQSGVCGPQMARVLHDIGIRHVGTYDSSLTGYESGLDAPAENPVFLHIGQMRARIRDLSRRVEDLEKRLLQSKLAGRAVL